MLSLSVSLVEADGLSLDWGNTIVSGLGVLSTGTDQGGSSGRSWMADRLPTIFLIYFPSFSILPLPLFISPICCSTPHPKSLNSHSVSSLAPTCTSCQGNGDKTRDSGVGEFMYSPHANSALQSMNTLRVFGK